MKNNAINEYKELDQEELSIRIAKMKQDYRLAAEDVRQGKEKNHASLKYLKRDIARAKTVLKLKEGK